MYEELIEQLRSRASWLEFATIATPTKTDGNGDAILFRKAADAIEELQGKSKVLEKIADKWCDAVPKWIPVTERLPDENDVVLITDSLDVGTGYLVHGYGWISPFDDIETSHVSHWMPLPKAPESDGE